MVVMPIIYSIEWALRYSPPYSISICDVNEGVSHLRECLGVKPLRVMKVKVVSATEVGIPHGRHYRPPITCDQGEEERICGDPKDGDLCLNRAKPS